jgi:glycerol-3-phosphate O-acyltransferase/dihydroxyacetone phosphate acyltransferase
MWALDRFYEVGRVGPAIPEGPVLVIANHPNSLIDGLVVMKVAGRRVRPLGKAPLFEKPLVGHMLRGLGALPVYRPQDFPGETWRNEDTFKEAVASLRAREAVLIFPEGLSHSESRLAKMKTGAARIALEAEEGVAWSLGLQVVPVGLTYHRKHAIRGRVAAAVGGGELARAARAR